MRRFLVHEKVRFIVVGIFNTSLDFTLLNIFVLVFGLPVIPANVISVSICIAISYFLNHHFVFQHESKANFKSFAMFLAVTGFSSLVIQSFIIWSFDVLHPLASNTALELNAAKATAVAVGMVWNFVLYKYLVFRKAAQKPGLGTSEG